MCRDLPYGGMLGMGGGERRALREGGPLVKSSLQRKSAA